MNRELFVADACGSLMTLYEIKFAIPFILKKSSEFIWASYESQCAFMIAAVICDDWDDKITAP